MNHLDLFSGIGGFSLGLKNAGISINNSYFSEIDKYAIQVYQNNFKESKYVGSVTDIRGEQLPKIDIITFGSPCQDFSLAGKRTGMQGNRSSLISEAIRLISECRPRFFIWENVKGTFSSNDSNDFWEIIKTFANIGGYRLEWQLLNTSWFLPQHRERIYLVGILGKGSGKEVFPIRENNQKVNELQRQSINTLATREPNSYIIKEKLIPQEKIIVKSATKVGYETATPGDAINLAFPGSTTKRGRVGKKQSQTLDTACNMGVYTDKIRRLTPLECERLQGFPDNWTQYGTDGLISDAQRYKMCGNAVTVDVVQAVGERIKNAI
tara:strand:- start:21073 stop:22044 length:972 start_codon:yes stop_codon:yes gene_type:complete